MPEKTLKMLFEENFENKIVLPDFQRTFEWEVAKQKSLLASTLVDLSIGALLFLKGRRGDFHAKALGVNSNNVTIPTDECLYLLDGQQRLTSLRAFFTDFFDSGTSDWEEIFDSLYKNLRCRWLICIKPETDDNDFFGYNSLHFEDSSQTAEPSALLSYISSVPILKARHDYWYHPNYSPKDEKGNPLESGMRKYAIINEAASEWKVPLYTLYSGDLHKEIIKKIASNRLDQIKYIINAEVDAQKRKKMVVSYLEPVNEMIGDDISQRPDDADFFDVYRDLWSDLRATWVTAVNNYFSSILSNKINIMELEKSQVARAIAIFTAINEGGQKLSPFDLIVAKAASDNAVPTLPERIRNFANQNMTISENWAPIPSSIANWTCSQVGCIEDDNKISKDFQDSFLNVLSAFVHTDFLEDPQNFAENLKGEYFKAQSQLDMTAAQINSYTELTMMSLARAHAFLQFRCGLVSGTDLPYRLMLLPIAFVLADERAWSRKDTFSKLEFWYWASIFSGTYREGQNEHSCTDSKLLYRWIVKRDISDADLNSLKARRDKMFASTDYSDEPTLTGANENAVPRAIHSAILQFVLSTQPVDFLPKDKFDEYKLCAWTCAEYQNKDREVFVNKKNEDGTVCKYKINLRLQDHHIIPLGSATRIGESSKSIRKDKKHPLNSPLNRTFISAEANKMISDDSPDKYYKDVFPVALAYHMVPDIMDEVKALEDKKEAYVAILKQRFETIKKALLKRLSDLLN